MHRLCVSEYISVICKKHTMSQIRLSLCSYITSTYVNQFSKVVVGGLIIYLLVANFL